MRIEALRNCSKPMGKVVFRFYEELNDHLPPGRRKRDFEACFQGRRTVQEVIETLGVPPREVDLVLINGRSAALDQVVCEGDRISVYPVFETLNVKGVSRVRKTPLRKLKFIVDKDLEGLAECLRALGLDVAFDPRLRREQIVKKANEEARVLLTREKHFFDSEGITHMILVKEGTVEDQVRRLLQELHMAW